VTDYRALLPIATRAAEAAAAFIRGADWPSDALKWQRKGISDFVTEIDRGAERIIADCLSEDLGNPIIMGEELTPDVTGDGVIWVVDPLDGTTNYLHGYPAYAVSIAAVVDGAPRVGVVLDVARNQKFHAVQGHGTWMNDIQRHVTKRITPEDSLIGTGFPFKHPQFLPSYLRQFATVLTATAGIRRAGAAALDLAHVACGWLDGFWELSLAPWDIAAGTLLVREAGGTVTDLDGSDRVVAHGSILAGNAPIHAWLLNTLR
jgi:myo-inositol-1(or 4)-monophosphatase